MQSTKMIKANEVERDWVVIDAEGKKFGRVLTEVATLLRGKHKPYYTPYVEYSYSSLRSEKNSYSVHLKHLSSAGKLKLEDYDEKVFAGYSNNLAEINTKHFVSRNSSFKNVLSESRSRLSRY